LRAELCDPEYWLPCLRAGGPSVVVWHFLKLVSEMSPFESNTQQDRGTYGLGLSLLPEND